VTVGGPGSVVEVLDTAQTAETMDQLATKAAAAVEAATLDVDELRQVIQDADAVLQPHILRHLLHQATSITIAPMAAMTSSQTTQMVVSNGLHLAGPSQEALG